LGLVSSIKFVDEVRSYTTESSLVELLQEINPDVRILGADHEGKKFTGYELNIKYVFNSRDHGFSTSELRKRVYNAEKNRLI
jgi:glycerol-3-phosphate cytidylyltransferase